MSQEEIDGEVMHWIEGYVLDNLMVDIHMLLKKEELYEKWLENNSQG